MELQPDQFTGFITSLKRLVLEGLKTRLRYETTHEFCSCRTLGCRRYIFEEAIKILFKCPTRHKPMTHLKSNRFIKILTQRMEQIEKELGK